MSGSEHSAVVVTTAAAASGRSTGASLRVDDVHDVLAGCGLSVTRVPLGQLAGLQGTSCLGVAVSYACAGSLRQLRLTTAAVWLDAVDSWLLVNGSGLRAAHPSYAARFARDAARLLVMPSPDLVTYISEADRRADRGTIRGRVRFVLPGSVPVPHAGPRAPGHRAVLAGDWSYAPNRDGLAWFCTEVLPLLEALLHDLDWRVELFGSGAPPLPPQIVNRGYVEDPAELLRIGDVHLAPIRHGAGVKRKVLQPLLAGLAVVTTTSGARGLRRPPALDVADDPTSFARAVARHLRGPTNFPPLGPADVHDCDETDAVREWVRVRLAACSHR
jgi:hypothetical protein